MPSDVKTVELVKLLAGAINTYQARVAHIADRVGLALATEAESPNGAAAEQLGAFAAGRIDLERFNALLEAPHVLDQLERTALTSAHDILREIATRPHEHFVVDLPPAGRLVAVLGHAFADLGRGIGATTVAELIRTRRYTNDDFALLHGVQRERWSRAERATSPPLIVTLDGADLWAGKIAQFLDGDQKVVLVVRPPAPPAPLVRLITPDTLVIQSCSVEGLAPLLNANGPAVAALMPVGAAEFVHKPGAPAMHERITITTRPTGARKSLEGWTAWQQQQELLQLYALASPPANSQQPTAKGQQPVSDPADRLAAWLIAHSEIPTPEGAK